MFLLYQPPDKGNLEGKMVFKFTSVCMKVTRAGIDQSTQTE